jgi:uncharacterized circularly permuted ATP-grasp superfamily protein/uncharacterized alpha-E superfamily protein
VTFPPGIDEMVDGRGGLRPHWRNLLGAFTGGAAGSLAEAARRVDRAFEDEGVTSILPGSEGLAWRCDPIPLPILADEFAELAAGLAQRAELLAAILGDLYGKQALLADGVLPPALAYSNPAFLRACRASAGGHVWQQRMEFYAADLIRDPNGAWRVLADRTAGASGIAHARENRRVLARVLPETFRGMQIRQLRPFFDLWQDALQRLAPGADGASRGNPSIALLTPGTGSPQWFEHMYLSRELSCGLVEGGDLTVRGGSVFLKTLRGLQPIDVLLRRLDGRMLDPLELEAGSMLGIPGLMDAARGGSVRITNDPGSGAVEAPALAEYLPSLALRLLGERLLLPSVPTMWLGRARARELVRQNPAKWLIRPATDGRAPAIALAGLSAAECENQLRLIEQRGWDYAASAAIPPSVAPSSGANGLQPKAIVLRLFLVFDGAEWRAMDGGLCRVVEADDTLAGALPNQGLSKDVWVLNEERREIIGPPPMPVPPLAIRRTTGELPSRIADNLFWLGRYVERLDTAARLVRAALARASRGAPMPREMVELQSLLASLAHAGLVPDEASAAATTTTALAETLLATVRDGGAIADLFAEVARLTELVRDRLTGDMYATFTSALRQARADAPRARRNMDEMAHTMVTVLRFANTVAGVAAENMVRGGAWLFLELGRRIERAQAVATDVAAALDQPPARIEAGLRLVLELCDSAITYRSRYLTVLQPAPALDLVLADPSNPRGLAFQLVAIRRLMDEVTGRPDSSLAAIAGSALADAEALVQRILAAPDQAREAASAPPVLREIATAIADLSDLLSRRYFALLPAAQTVGLGGELPTLRGAA